jgi:hypothetical protein
LKSDLHAIGRPGFNLLEVLPFFFALGIPAFRALRAAFAIFDRKGRGALNLDEIQSRRQAEVATGERQAAKSSFLVRSFGAIPGTFHAGSVHSPMNAIALFGILARDVDALDFHVIEETRAISVLGDVSCRPKAFIHDYVPR